MAVVSTLAGPLVWGSKLANTPEEFILSLDEQGRDEVRAALKELKDKGLGLKAITSETFPLPGLKDCLRKACEEIHEGKGFVVVKGLDIGPLSPEDWAAVELGVASYIGDEQGVQNKDGHVMVHVTEFKEWTTPREQRHGIHSPESLPHHSDMGAGIIVLQVRSRAESGGATYLASASTIYNDLAANNPAALAALLRNDWPVQVSGAGKYITAPAMQVHDGKLVASVDPARLGPHPSSVVTAGEEGVPKLTPEQESALEALNRSAKKHEVALDLQKGDILFINNWAMFHRRDRYEDGEDTSRHLVRLWLRNTKLGWKIPDSMAVPWKQAFEGVVKKVYNPEPEKVYKTPKFTAGSAAFPIEDAESTA